MLMRGRLGGFSVGRYWCGGDKPPQSARKNGAGEILRRCRQPLTEQHALQSRSSTSHTPQQKDTVHRELRPGKGRGPALAQDCCTTPHGLVRTSPVPRSRRRPPRSRRPTRHVPRQQQREMRTSCRQQPAPPLRDAAKMTPRISIGPEPVLAAQYLSCPVTSSLADPLIAELHTRFS